MRRRTFVAVGVGTFAAALVAPYLQLAPGDNFEQLVANELGIDVDLASQLLEAVRDEYGGAEYDARAAAFGLAVRNPAASIVPSRFRESAIKGLIEPMFSTPSATLAYAVTGDDPAAKACAGLVRDR